MLRDEAKTKEQLVSELALLSQRITEWETLETEHKQAEKMPSVAEDYYKLFELIPIGVTMLDMKGTILYSNSAVYSKGGYTEGEFTGKHFSKIASVRVKDIPTFIRLFSSIVRGKIPKLFEAIYQHKDGTTGWTELNINLIKVGGKRRILVMQHDITERKQAEETLRESEEKYGSLVKNVKLGVFRSTPEPTGRFLEVNPAMVEITGYSRKELLQMNVSGLYVHPEERESVLEEIASATGKEIKELPLRKKDGTEIVASDIKVAVRDNSGKIIYFDGIMEDITERKQAEEALRASEEKYRSLFKSMLNAFAYCKILVDENNQPIDFVHLEVNDAWERAIGLKREDVIGKKITEVIPGIKESKTDLISIYGKVALTGEATKFDLFFEPLDKWFTVSVYSPQKGYFVAIFEDITERKKAEEALRESEGKLRLMFESVTDGITVTDLNGIVIDANDRTAEIHGFRSKNEVLGKNAFAFIVAHERERAVVNMQKTLEEGSVRGIEYTLIRADGSEFPGELSASVVKATSGNPVGFIAITRDITERKQAEEELRESEENYKELYENAPIMLYTLSGKGVLLDCNKALLEAFGRSREEMIGKLIYDFQTEESRKQAPKALQKVATEGTLHGERDIITKDGKLITIEFDAHIEYDKERNETVIKSATKDITERKQAEEREKGLQQELYLSSRLAAIGELAAGVAHEINNPLTGVLGFSERLLRKSTDEKLSRDLEIIHSEALRAAKVVENLLTFARRRGPKKEYSDINDIVHKALELRAYELKTSNIEVTLDLLPTLPKTMVDFLQIQEVFLNLILNAEQAMSEANLGGKLVIKTQEVKGYIRTSFTDDGPGIPAEYLDKLFDPFFTMRGEEGGTGLGLSICHGIVLEHGGKIYAKSRLGKGATFFVELPVTST